MKKIVIIFGTRPEAIKLAPVVKAFREEKGFNTVVVSTAQHRELLADVLDVFSLKPDYDLKIMKQNQSPTDVTAAVVTKLEPVLKKEKPDMVIVQGDTATTAFSALAAFYQKIPVAHIEAGLRTDDKYQPFPEEINRRIVSVIADLHFAATERAKENLLAEGVKESSIFVTGNTVIDALLATAAKINSSPTRLQRLKAKFPFIGSHTRIILITAHRRENFGRPFEQIADSFVQIVENFPDTELVYPVHPNPNVRSVMFERLTDIERIHLIEPVSYEEFIFLMQNSYLILTDSGGVQEEAPSLNLPVLILRAVTERPEVLTCGAGRLVGSDTERIVNEVKLLLEDQSHYNEMANCENPFGDGRAAERIMEAVKVLFRGNEGRR